MTGSKNDANISGINADSTSTNSIRCALECISGEKKVDVAVSQLAERYTALHQIVSPLGRVSLAICSCGSIATIRAFMV